jgi:hypothetical protein
VDRFPAIVDVRESVARTHAFKGFVPLQTVGCRSRIIRRFLSASELPREGGECVSAGKVGDDLADDLKVVQVGEIARCGGLAPGKFAPDELTGRGEAVRKTLRPSLRHPHIRHRPVNDEFSTSAIGR